jgi:hypothetical protein
MTFMTQDDLILTHSLGGFLEELPYGGVVVNRGESQHLDAQVRLPPAQVQAFSQVLQ